MKTQIIATIGPASIKTEVLEAIIPKITAVRLNFSWGENEERKTWIENIREVSSRVGNKIIIIADFSGPRLKEEGGHEFDKSCESDITAKDLTDLAFCLSHDIDQVAMSYVGSAKDIEDLRADMQKIGKVLPIIAKIERSCAVQNLDEIIAVADAIMVARGDLGNEIPLEQIPFVEKDIIAKCNAVGKPVIVATQMLLSMTDQPFPTRAEVTDVAYAVVSGADAVMLSEETAKGNYPVEAVSEMERIIIESMQHISSGASSVIEI